MDQFVILVKKIERFYNDSVKEMIKKLDNEEKFGRKNNIFLCKLNKKCYKNPIRIIIIDT